MDANDEAREEIRILAKGLKAKVNKPVLDQIEAYGAEL
jgi:hypothetical protein